MENARKWMRVGLLGVSLIAFGLAMPLTLSMFSNFDHSSEGIGLRGKVDIVLYDANSQIKEERHLDNLIVSSGIEGIAYLIAPHDGSIHPSTPYNYIALGTSNTAVDASQAALVAELPTGASYARMQDSTATYTTSGGNKLVLSVLYAPGQGTGTLRESGIFDAATSGHMLARQTFNEIQKAAGDSLTITWTITLSQT